MILKDFLQQISDDVKAVNASDFDVQVIETQVVPATDDKDITYENFDTRQKKCKLIETCVLYIDIRKSTELSLSHYPKTLTKLYSSFAKSMVKSARYYGGHIRNIIGDRVMVVFDSEKCFTNAVCTAILMNTIAANIINKHFKNNEVKCGIGIDYGKMLVTKVGTIKQGIDNPDYKALVWLGKPANIASKLTDIANKEKSEKVVSEGYYYPLTDKWAWVDISHDSFIDNLESLHSGELLKHKKPYFRAFIKDISKIMSCPILMTEMVYQGFCRENPYNISVTNKWWEIQSISIPEYDGAIYGGDIYFKAITEVK